MLFIILLFVTRICAQVDQFDIEYLSDEYSTCVQVDEEGYIWFPNYEENDFMRYTGHEPFLLGLPKILNEAFDHYRLGKPIFIEGELLVSSKKKISLIELTTSRLETIFELPAKQSIEYVYQDDSGAVFIFAMTDSRNFRPVYYAKDGRSYDLAFDLYEHFGNEQIPLGFNVNDANGLLYFHGLYDGLTILNNKGEKQELFLKDPQEFKDKYACSVFRLDNKNKLWRLHRKDIEIYNPIDGTFIMLPLSGRIEVNSNCPESKKTGWTTKVIYEDSKGRIWVGGEDSYLFMVDMTTGSFTSFSKKLIDDIGGRGGSIATLTEDKNGNIYGAKRGGVFKISAKTDYFENYLTDLKNIDHPIYKFEPNSKQETAFQLLQENEIVNALLRGLGEDENGNLITSDFRFVFKIDPSSGKSEVLPLFGPNSNIKFNANKDKRIVSLWGHAYHYDKDYNIIFIKNKPKRLEEVLFQKNGNIWYSGYRGAQTPTEEYIPLFAKANPTSLEFEENFVDPEGHVDFDKIYVSSMSEDQTGNIFLGTSVGIVRIDSETGKVSKIGSEFKWKETYIKLNAQKAIKVQVIEKNKIGFNSSSVFGVLNTEKKSLERFITKEKLALEKINCSFFTNNNEVWIGSKELFSYYNFDTEEYIHFSSDDGYNIVDLTSFIKPLTNGRFAVGTDNGLNIFHPDSLLQQYRRNSFRDRNTRLELTHYSFIKGKSDTIINKNHFSHGDNGLVFNYDDKMIQLDFSLLDFSKPSNHVYSYWLEGLDKKWSNPVNSHSIQYTSLEAGNYNLKVRANNGNGVWSSDELSIDIRVKQAWYKTWLFISLCLLFFLAAAYAFVKHYLSLEKSRLDKLVREQETIQLKELDDAKNLFFTSITHEFRTPLTVIKGVNENSDAASKEKSLIRRNSNQLLQLINQLLDLSKLESRKLKLNLGQGDMVKFAQYLTASFYSMAIEKKIQLHFNSNIDELIMNFDEVRVQQIIYNVLSNALKFTPEGGAVEVNLSIKEGDAPHLKISIKDSGCGIPKQDIPHLFDHFYQVSNSITKVGEGTGIGLSLTKELVELMEGTIEVTSELNSGSEFIVYLPIQTKFSDALISTNFNIDKEAIFDYVSNEASQKSSLVTPESQSSENNLPILLLIEDNADVVTYICSILDEKYQIVICVNGEIGITKAIEIVPDIIISDVMMPIKDGFEVCQTLKQHKITDHIPIILLTAKANHSDRIEGLKYGADAYINKPFVKEELLVRLEQLLLVRTRIQEKYQQILAPQEAISEKKDAFFNTLKDVVMENLADHLFGVPEMAKSLFMSQPQVYRKCKALLDKTPTAFINMMRLNKAKELLLNSEHTIAEVASLSGYKDANYFSRVFQNAFGSSPSVFRKRHIVS